MENIYRDTWDLVPGKQEEFSLISESSNSNNISIEIRAIRPSNFTGSVSVSLRDGLGTVNANSFYVSNGYLKESLIGHFTDVNFNWIKLECKLDKVLLEVNLLKEQLTYFN